MATLKAFRDHRRVSGLVRGYGKEIQIPGLIKIIIPRLIHLKPE